MRKKIDYFKAITGKKLSQIHHSYQQDFVGYWNSTLNSKYKPILIGRDAETGKPFYVSVEQLMNHMHFIAPTKKGKSSFFIYLAQEIARRGFGFFVMDSSDKGDTVKKLLGFCQRENKKYLYIDLNEKNNPVLNPFEKNQYKSVSYLSDAFKVLFNVKDQAATANIAKYLPALLHVLMNAKLTLAEARYFTNRIYKHQQAYILQLSRKNELDSRHRELLQEAFSVWRIYERFISTTSRLEPLFHPAIEALFGDHSSVKLHELIEKNYIILLNVDCDELGELQKRLVATVIINLILYHHPSGKPYWMFIDEAEDYATSKVGEILDKKAKAGLNVGLMNHFEEQFEDRRLRGSVKINAPIKFEFPKKQEAWVTLNEMETVYLRLPTVHMEYGEIKGSPFNRDREKILQKIRQRIPYDLTEGTDSKPSRADEVADRKTINHPKDRPKTVFDD
jgi:hypothetical protein